MPLLESPLHVFSNATFEQNQVHLRLEMPWPLPWGVGALRTALAWELAASCERHQQLIPRLTSNALNSLADLKTEISDYGWLDGAFSRNADRILARIAEDISRVQPKPTMTIIGPLPDAEDLEALGELGEYLGIVVNCTAKPPDGVTTAEAEAALSLLGSAGLVNVGLGKMLIRAAEEAGNAPLVAALSDVVGGEWEGCRIFSAYDVSPNYEYLAPVLAALGRVAWPDTIPDWHDLDLPYLLENLWVRPRNTLDRLRSDSARLGKTSRNAFRVRLCIARHFLKCFLGDSGLAAPLDLLDASTALRNNQPVRAWQLLAPHVNDPELLRDAALAAHVYGHAGQAAARLDQPEDALALYEKNLACLGRAFGTSTNQYRNALASLHHKIGQLLREHPKLPGGFSQARHHLEQSLELHKLLDRPGGVSMCLNDLGKLSMEEGDFEGAKAWLEDALELDRRNRNSLGESRILHDLAILHERTGEFSKALDYVEQCEQVQQSAGVGGNLRQRLLNTRTRLRDMLGIENESKPETPLEILNSISSDEPRTFCTLVSQSSRTLRQQSRYAEAEALLTEALKRPIPEAHRQYLRLAMVNLLLDLRRQDEAREMLDDIEPQSERTKDELALLKARLECQAGNYEQADTIITAISADNQPEVLARVHLTRGHILFQQGNFAEAAAQFKEARGHSQGSIYASRLAMEKEARAYIAMGEYQNAADLAGHLAEAAATGKWKLRQVRAAMMLGDALLCLGRAREAADEFERALKLSRASEGTDTSRMVALERRAARAWGAAGNPDAALAHIRIAQEMSEQEDVQLDQRGWIYHLAAHLHRASGDVSGYEAALRVAEQCALGSGSKPLQQAVITMKQGDWRQDDWTMDDFDWEEDGTPRVAIGRARRLRMRSKLDEALSSLAPFEGAQMDEPVRREIQELKLGIQLDLHERGSEVDFRGTLTQLVAGRPYDELSSKLLLLMARADMQERRFEPAIDTALRAYGKASEMGEFYSVARAGVILSKSLTEIGRQSEAINILQRIADYMQEHGRQQFAFDAKYSLSRQMIGARRFDEARQYLRQLNDGSSKLSLADWVRLELAHAEIERIEFKSTEAIARLNEVIRRVEAEGRPELKAEATRLLNAILLDNGQLRSVQSSPRDDSSRGLSATKSTVAAIKELQQSGRHQEAIALAEQILEKEGSAASRTRAIVLHQAAKSYFKGKNRDKAADLCRQSLELHTRLGMNGTPGVRVTLADILVVEGHDEEARRQLLLALEENRTMRDERGVQICQRRLEQFSGHIPSAGRVATARDLLSHAQTLRRKGLFVEALKAITEALQQARAEQDEWAEAQALGALGINSFKARNFLQAEQYLKEAVAMHSRLNSANLGECVSYLARAYERLRRVEEGRELVRLALGSNLRPDEREKMQNLLEWLEGRN
ncbi:MAG: tetratricopeptide repeat protein [Pyrinomonadaceae bacterium]